MRLKVFLLTCLLLAKVSIMFGQTDSRERLSIVFDKVSLIDALIQLDQASVLDFAYDPNILSESKVVNVTFDDYSIQEILDYLLAESEAVYKIVEGQVIITKKKKQTEFIVKGYIEDDATKEKLAYATLYFAEIELGVTANEQGYYSIKIPSGAHTIHISYVGRDEQTVKLDVLSNMNQSFTLSEIQSLKEVVITPDVIQGGSALLRSYQTQAIQQLALQTPAVGGESDVLNIIRNLPGIESNAGGVGGMFVRGGEDDQNLVLMDGVPIYYPSHLLGIYSIFNAESVRNIEVYKGAFPARYGGKLSSVVDIYTKDGRKDGWHGDISGSYQSIRGSIQGPLTKKINIMLGRRTSLVAPYINDVIGESFYRVDGDAVRTNYRDFNFKMNIQTSKKSKLVLSHYSGRDSVYVKEQGGEIVTEYESDLTWSNRTYSLAYQRELGRNSFLKVSQTFNYFDSGYQELLEYEQYTSAIGQYLFLNTYSSNLDTDTKISVDHFVNPNVTNRYGISFSNNQFQLSTESKAESEFGPVDESKLDLNFFPLSSDEFTAWLTAAYFEQERRISSKVFANIGLRYSSFSSELEEYRHLEPRLALKYNAKDKQTYNLAISKMVQYVHQLSDANLSFPKDVWLPANETFLPSISWQFGAGMNKALKNNMNVDVQVFYKDLQNLNYVTDIYNLTDDLRNPVDSIIGTGNGTSYGLEIATEIPFQKFHWTNALTLSKSNRQFERINNNQPHPFQYDRRVVLKSALTYKMSKRFTIGSRLYIGSATPQYLVRSNGESRNGFTNIIPADPTNSERARGQYRFDISATLNLETVKIKHHFKANFYNVFNTRNPGFTYFNPSNTSAVRDDVFSLPFIPSIQYNISF